MTSQSFKEFKDIIQGKKLERRRKRKDWWHAIFTFISRYVTWVLVKTKITANFITILGLMIGLIGLLLIAFGNSFFIIIGIILLYICYLLDEVDGEVARYKQQTSLRGIYYDQIGHLLFLGGFFFSFGYSIYRINEEFLFIFLGAFSSYFILGIRTIRKIAIIALTKGGDMKNSAEEVPTAIETIDKKKGFIGIVKMILMNLLNAFSHTHVITTIFFVGFLLYINFGYIMILEFFMIGYFIFMFIIFSAFIIFRFKSIEEDVLKIHQSLKNH